MGVVNLAPDSFSGDGGDPQAALARARRLLAEGADLLDIGAESTRPRSEPVAEAVELARLAPVLQALAANPPRFSIDTMKPAVARRAVAAGAAMWNDVTALSFAPESAAVAAELGCEVVLMHMQGTPATMQVQPRYGDVVSEVLAFLEARARVAIEAGVAAGKIWLDPGIGFGKTVAHNLALLGALPRLVGLGFPVLLGVSRKGFVRALDPTAERPADRLPGSIAAALAGAAAGVAALRVHDVAPTLQALKVQAAIQGAADA